MSQRESSPAGRTVVAELMAGAIASIARDQEMFREMAEAACRAHLASPAVQQTIRISRNIAEWKEAQVKTGALLAPYGWLLPVHLAFQGGAARIIALAESQGIEAAEAALLEQLGPEECQRVLFDCVSAPAFLQWKPHMEAAMNAHVRGEYLLAIPVWLLVFDGVAQDRLATALRKGSIFSKMSKKHRTALLAKLGAESFGSEYMKVFLRALDATHEDHGSELGLSLSATRHAVMHGRDADYGTEKRSIQCILMLGALGTGVEE